ncbi:MAG: endonuclease MutS2 [Anaerolineae bacterium]|nr:endonuclease MutS2 [Anaerolineae bacterium]
MISEKSIHTLELTKILDQVARHASFSAGAALARDHQPTTSLEEARIWQRETGEALALLNDKAPLSVAGARDVREVAINAARGVLIEAPVLLDIRQTLRRAGIVRRTLEKQQQHYPLLAEHAREIEECRTLQESITACLDDNGEVKDSASARLAIIRRDLKVAFERLQSKLRRILSSRTNELYLQEALVTTRNGRYVIPIKADHKGKIPGIVHDSSSSGATLFIEPLETVELNNAWRELQLEEEKEIRRILAALTDQVGEEGENIVRAVEILGYLDFVNARALHAQHTRAVQPRLVSFSGKEDPRHPGSTIYLKSARHPLLSGNVVPVDLEFDARTWIMVITGPNTGGKTVSLKTVGLLALMAQSGLHVPAEEAAFTVFDGIYADIGDEQSIEQSLSTFSSHMTNIIGILRECSPQSLVILDELGAGTDPAEGSALARALLNRLLERRVTTMVSTHHPELKIYAVETPGVRNASVEFNLETLAPTYRLMVGLPGRSNALAIATRLGLDPDIVTAARGMVATEDLVADDLLDEIQRTRHDMQQQRGQIEALHSELQQQRDDLQARLDKIEDERRDVVRAARRHAEDELEGFRREIKKLQSELRSAGMPLERLRAVQETAEKLTTWMQPEDAGEVERVVDTTWVPRLGDTVYMDSLNTEGTIVEMDGKEATVQVGNLRVRAKFSDIRRRDRSERRAEKRGRKVYAPSTATIPPTVSSPGIELDLRGMRIEEALEKLDRYIDSAYLSGLPFGRIIHGKGTGRLREAIREYAEAHALISKIVSADTKDGGAGVTIIHMVPTS